MEGQFFYKKLVKEIPLNAIWITKDIFCIPIKSRFGDLQPNINSFLKFLNISYFIQGHENYNRYGLSNQIAAETVYLVPVNIKLINPYWKKIYKFKKVDKKLFKKFSYIEYIVYDILSNLNNIFSDLFHNDNIKIKYTKKLIKDLKIKYKSDLNVSKCLKEASKNNKNLKNLFNIK